MHEASVRSAAGVGASRDAAPVMRRYAVVGHPVTHSLSPEIHAAFGRQTGHILDYRRLTAPLDGFAETVRRFVDDGGHGLNVTVPFKREAHALCGDRLSDRACRAGAVNCIATDAGGLYGDNTDGAGLVVDLARLASAAGFRLAGVRVLLVGAGGAARGVVGPLLDAGPSVLVVVNRDAAKAAALVASFAGRAGHPDLRVRTFADVDGDAFDIVVNATSASLGGATLPLPRSAFAGARLAYDMMYGAAPTPFLVDAANGGAASVADGLGMLVEQAAESFAIWHGIRPDTRPVLDALRAKLAGTT